MSRGACIVSLRRLDAISRALEQKVTDGIASSARFGAVLRGSSNRRNTVLALSAKEFSRIFEQRPSGSVREDRGNPVPYRDMPCRRSALTKPEIRGDQAGPAGWRTGPYD